MTPRSITAEQAFLEEIENVRLQGYAEDDQEHVKGVRCTAVPVFDHKGHIAAAISLSTLTSTADNRDFERFSGLLQQIGQKISSTLGHH
jgi:DNA-binding IclR family transcriptional regulator